MKRSGSWIGDGGGGCMGDGGTSCIGTKHIIGDGGSSFAGCAVPAFG